MRFLLDENDLIDLGYVDHPLNSQMVAWLQATEDVEHTADGQVIDLAKGHICKLNAFDARIPAAFLIP